MSPVKLASCYISIHRIILWVLSSCHCDAPSSTLEMSQSASTSDQQAIKFCIIWVAQITWYFAHQCPFSLRPTNAGLGKIPDHLDLNILLIFTVNLYQARDLRSQTNIFHITPSQCLLFHIVPFVSLTYLRVGPLELELLGKHAKDQFYLSNGQPVFSLKILLGWIHTHNPLNRNTI